ncbi:MAG: hypothetical protein RI978_970 [Verrucomicrobiota bacterium]|jgi:hypothetical protein
MRDFLGLPDDVKRAAYLKVEEAKDLRATSVEKDLWVCLTLRELFSLPGIGEKLTFKGGTSLSKAWGIIERFSEDIDIVVDKELLGINPSEVPVFPCSKSQQDKWKKRLDKASNEWMKADLIPALQAAFGRLGCEIVYVDKSPGSIQIKYPSVFVQDAGGYVGDKVKIEPGARPENYPRDERLITAYVLEEIPSLSSERGFKVRAISPLRTFWEKVCLLHEDRLRPADKPRKAERLSRHYYDVWCMDRKGEADKAIADAELLRQIVSDRRVSYPVPWADYDSLTYGKFRILPNDGDLVFWRTDYEKMRLEMFFGDSPTFDQLMAEVRNLQDRLNGAGR